MEDARDLAKQMEAEGQGVVLDQFGNLDNPAAHYSGTGERDCGRIRGGCLQAVRLASVQCSCVALVQLWPCNCTPHSMTATSISRSHGVERSALLCIPLMCCFVLLMPPGPELWEQTQGRITHFVSSMGTTGTIMGTGRYLHERNPAIQVRCEQSHRHAQSMPV